MDSHSKSNPFCATPTCVQCNWKRSLLWTQEGWIYQTGAIFPSLQVSPSLAQAKQSSTATRDGLLSPWGMYKSTQRGHEVRHKAHFHLVAALRTSRPAVNLWPRDYTTPSRAALGSPPGCVADSVRVSVLRANGRNAAKVKPEPQLFSWCNVSLYEHPRCSSLPSS